MKTISFTIFSLMQERSTLFLLASFTSPPKIKMLLSKVSTKSNQRLLEKNRFVFGVSVFGIFKMIMSIASFFHHDPPCCFCLLLVFLSLNLFWFFFPLCFSFSWFLGLPPFSCLVDLKQHHD